MAVIFLDFDGVINAVSGKPPTNLHPKETWKQTICTEKKDYPIMYSTVVVDFINELSKTNDIYWLTTWRSYTHQFEEKLGLVELPYIDEEGLPVVDGEWWKLTVARDFIKEHVDADEKIVWIDDDLRYSRSKEAHALGQYNILYVGPAMQHGLSIKEMRQIKEFCEEG